MNGEKKIDCNPPQKLTDIIMNFKDIIDENEKLIKKADGFRLIRIEYNKVMDLYQKRISDILKNKLYENQKNWDEEERKLGIIY